MRFHYNKLILWMKNGNIRTLDFKPNKVNIITGASESGKSEILAIIDYCFFADKNIKITEEYINENVQWYGINFSINDKVYTIGRKSLEAGIPSKEYYFSMDGEIPEKLSESISEDKLKEVLNTEFGINENVIIPYGGKKIKAGSKISIRYFMLFNSQDQDTIDNSDVFFDKQTDPKYQEALERIFDIAVGISNEKNVLIKEKIDSINKDINKYERKQRAIDNQISSFESDKLELVKKAKELGLISNDSLDIDECIESILDLSKCNTIEFDVESSEKLDTLCDKERKIKRDIKIIKNFLHEYNDYKDLMKVKLDSLKPIKYLTDNYSELINHPSVGNILNGLENNYNCMLAEMNKLKKNDYGMNEKLKKLSNDLMEIREKIRVETLQEKNANIIDKYMFLGEAKAKIELYNGDEEKEDYTKKIDELKHELTDLNVQLENFNDKKVAIIRLIELSSKKMMDKCKKAMETYGDYIPVLNYKNKKLELMNPVVAQIAKVVGSSSNYMFLHLIYMLALHEVIIAQHIQYVPSYLILDQPSRPYYDNNNERFKDKEKVTIAIQLLNDYIDIINAEYKEEFQFIVFEHIPKEIWKEMKNVHLVEEFTGENIHMRFLRDLK